MAIGETNVISSGGEAQVHQITEIGSSIWPTSAFAGEYLETTSGSTNFIIRGVQTGHDIPWGMEAGSLFNNRYWFIMPDEDIRIEL